MASASTLKETWDLLEKMFKGVNRVKPMHPQTLRGELEAMKMKDSWMYLVTLIVCKQ